MSSISDDAQQIEPQLRTLLMELLGRKWDFATPMTVDLICTELAILARDRGLRFGHHEAWHNSRGTVSLHANLPSKISDLVWDFIVEGIIRPGSGFGNWLPYFHITEFGMQAINEPTSPYDPDGYIRMIKAKVPEVDDVIIRYIGESVQTFRKNCLLSSSITLGCASEKAFLLVLDAYRDALNSTDRAEFIKKNQSEFSIKKRHEDFETRYRTKLRPLLKPDMGADRLSFLDDVLQFIFNYLRDSRNDFGHPSGKIPIREMAHGHLVMFPAYLKALYQLKDWLSKNKIP